MGVNKYLEHTLLKPEASAREIEQLCEEAVSCGLLGVCVNPNRVALAKKLLCGSNVKVVTVVGFPLGAERSEVKALAAELAVCEDGADEIDMVMNIGALKDKNYDLVRKDIAAVVRASSPAPVKVIIETCLLTEEEKGIACRLIAEGGAHFVKTSTGFNKYGATEEDVFLLAEEAQKLGLQVKAAGGIRDLTTVKKMLKAGANRIGTSCGVKIFAEEIEQ